MIKFITFSLSQCDRVKFRSQNAHRKKRTRKTDLSNRQTERQKDRKAERQKTERQKDRKPERHRDRKIDV